jgi:Cof subfamily protein (haloacid dehalogenase superfamily)
VKNSQTPNIELYNPVKGVLLDIDGTLLDSNRTFSDEKKKDIKAISKKGIHIGVATSRHFAAIYKKILPYFPKNSIHITSCGAQIVSISGEIIWQKLLDKKSAGNLINDIEKLGGAVVFGSGTGMVCSRNIYENLKNHPWSWNVSVYDPEVIYNFALVTVVEVNPGVEKYMKTLHDMNIYKLDSSSGSKYFDIVDKNVNKLKAAVIWSEKLGISLENVAAAGDSENDFDLIAGAGLGIAMNDSPEKLKSVAKIIIGNSDDNGLTEFLNTITGN